MTYEHDDNYQLRPDDPLLDFDVSDLGDFWLPVPLLQVQDWLRWHWITELQAAMLFIAYCIAFVILERNDQP